MGPSVPSSELDFDIGSTFPGAAAQHRAPVYANYAISAWRNAEPHVRRELAELPANVTRGVADARLSANSNAPSVP